MMSGRTFKKLGAGLAVILISSLTAVISAEIFLRMLWNGYGQQYHSFPPNETYLFTTTEEQTPGVSGDGRFQINEMGMRSDPFDKNAESIVYVLGGSTAAGVYLDQSEAWPQLLQEKLSQSGEFGRTWVGNLSRSSLTAYHNILQFQYMVPSLPKPSLFLNLLGVNDLQYALRSSFLPQMTEEDHMKWTFAVRPRKGDWYQTTALYQFIDHLLDVRKRSAIGVTQTFNAAGYDILRKCRAEARERLPLPNIEKDLDLYESRLLKLNRMSREAGAPMVFMTQPTIWRKNMSDKARSQMTTGGIGPGSSWCKNGVYYSEEAMAKGMQAFNERLLKVCAREKFPCIDLATKLGPSPDLYYDGMHFNEKGSERLSEIVAEALIRFRAAKLI